MIAFNQVKKPVPYVAPSKKRDISTVDFSPILDTYSACLKDSRIEYEEKLEERKAEFGRKKQEEAAREYNATHEDTFEEGAYEGDYDEMDIEPFDNRLSVSEQKYYTEFMEDWVKP